MDTTTILLLLIIGVFAGMLSGLVGVGGGIIIVPCLVYFLAVGQKQAQGTSLAVLCLPVVIVGVINYYKKGQVNLNYVPLIALGFLVGGYWGSKIALRINDATLKKIFAILLMLISLKMLFLDKPKDIKENKTATNNFSES